MTPKRVFLSWAHGGPEPAVRAQQMVELANLLREAGGLDARIDLFEEQSDAADWTRWGELEVARAEYVLCVLSPEWNSRWTGTNNPRTGAGAVSEANVLRSLFQDNQQAFITKVKLVTIPSDPTMGPPAGLHGVRRFTIKSFDAAGIEDIVRTLMARPAVRMAPIGTVPDLPPVHGLSGQNRGATAEAALRVGTIRVADRRSHYLPQGVAIDDLHQDVQVSVVKQDVRAVDGPSDETLTNEPQVRWNTDRLPWRSVVVEGPPGAGKSWLLALHARRLANSEATDGPPPIPILLACAAVARQLPTDPSVEDVLVALGEALRKDPDYAREVLDLTDLDEQIAAFWRKGRFVVCLDGLDETPTTKVVSLQRAINLVLAGKNALILGSRSSAVDDLAGRSELVRVRLVPFPPRRIVLFVNAWFARRPAVAASLRYRLSGDRTLRTLLSNPLMLRFVCQLAEAGRSVDSLPSSRVSILRELSLALLTGEYNRREELRAIPRVNPPDAHGRLSALAAAVGALSSSWREGEATIDRSALETAILETTNGKRIAAASLARWNEVQRISGAEDQSELPLNLVTWELLLDGFLVEQQTGAARRVAFAHPLLHAYVLGLFAASGTSGECVQQVERHSWFDEIWSEAVPIGIALAAGRAQVVDALLRLPEDAWFVRRLLLVKALEADPAAFADHTREAILAGLDEAISAPRRFDRNRAVDALVDLLDRDATLATALAKDRLADGALDGVLSTRIVIALLRSGDRTVLPAAKKALTGSMIDATMRGQLLAAILAEGDAETAHALPSMLDEAMGSKAEILEHFPLEEERVRTALADALMSTRIPNSWSAAAAGVLSEYTTEFSRSLVDRLRVSTLVPLQTRIGAALAIAQRGGFPEALELASSLAANPNATIEMRASVRVAQLLDTFAFDDRAVDVLLDQNVYWQHRARIASLAVATDAERLRGLAQRDESAWVRIRLIVPLIERGDEWAVEAAKQLAVQQAISFEVRTRLWASLVAHVADVDLEAAAAHALSARAPDWALDDLVVALAARGFAFGSAFFESWPPSAPGAYRRLLLASSAVGSALEPVALDERQKIGQRLVIASALIESELGTGPRSGRLLSDVRFADFRDRLILVQARAQNAGVIDEIVERLTTILGAYPALFALLSDAKVDQDRMLAARAAASRVSAERPADTPLRADRNERIVELLKALPNRDVGLLEERVGVGISRSMEPSELDEYEALAADEDQAMEWLSTWFPAYQLVVLQELEALLTQRGDRDAPRTESLLLRAIASTAESMREIAEADGFVIGRETIARINSVAPAPSNVVDAVLGPVMQRSSSMYFEALYALCHLHAAGRLGLAASQWPDALLNRVREELDTDKLFAAHADSTLARHLFPEDYIVAFYAGLTAALVGLQRYGEDMLRRCVALGVPEEQLRQGRGTLEDEIERGRLSAEQGDRLLMALQR